ncbi:MAG: hypothetical protein PW786_13210 [Arachidicoccus sp.]|nr:hypothetical protein [Arachidicoccus sp.]
MFQGKYLGTIADFKVANMSVKDQDGMIASGELTMRGLPEIDTTLIDVESLNANVTYRQLLPIVPQLKEVTNPNLSALGNGHFKGYFKGTIHSFALGGNMHTALGADSLQLTMTLPEKGNPTYKGSIATNQFNLGKFIGNDSTLGNIAFKEKI